MRIDGKMKYLGLYHDEMKGEGESMIEGVDDGDNDNLIEDDDHHE